MFSCAKPLSFSSSFCQSLLSDYCPMGQQGDAEGSCTECPRGTYKDNEGLTRFEVCQSCDPGRTTETIGSTSEQDCSIRMY